MTRKDYILIAAAIRTALEDIIREANRGVLLPQFETLADAIAKALASDNPRFDRERFLKACGVQS